VPASLYPGSTNWPSHSSSGTAAFPEEVFYRSRCEISVVNPLSKNGVTAGSLQLSPTLSMREQSAESWSFLALPAAPIERALFAVGVFVVK